MCGRQEILCLSRKVEDNAKQLLSWSILNWDATDCKHDFFLLCVCYSCTRGWSLASTQTARLPQSACGSEPIRDGPDCTARPDRVGFLISAVTYWEGVPCSPPPLPRPSPPLLPFTFISQSAVVWRGLQTQQIEGRDMGPLTGDLWSDYLTLALTHTLLYLLTPCISSTVCLHLIPLTLSNYAARLLFAGCLTSQQRASVYRGRICSVNFTCCYTEIEVVDHTIYLTQSLYTDTGPTSPSTDPITPGAWQGSRWSAILKSLVWLNPEKIPSQAGFEPGIFLSRGGRLNH